MSDIKNLNLGRETLGATAAKIVMALAGFVGTIVFARVLGPSTYGGVGLIVTLAGIVDKPIEGWGIAGKKRVSEDVKNTPQVLGAQIAGNSIWIALVSIGALLFAGKITSYTGLAKPPLFLVLLLSTVGMFSTFQSLLKGHGRVNLATWVDTLRSYLTLPFQVGLVLFGWGAAGMVYGLAAASAVMIPLTLYYLGTSPALPGRTQLRSLWEYAQYSIPSTAFNLIYNRLDILVLGALLTPSAVGYYDIAWKLTLPAMFVVQAAGPSLMSKLSALDAAGEATNKDLVNTLSFTSIFAIPTFVGAVILHRDLVVTLYGPGFAPAGTLLVGLAALRIISTQSEPLIQALNGLDRPDVTMWITGTTLVGNVILGIGLTIVLGPIGVVIATLAAEAARYVAAVMLLRRELAPFPLFPRPLVEQMVASLLMGGTVLIFSRYVTIRGWEDLSLLIGVGVIVYSMVLLVISMQLRRTVRSALSAST
jgi:O-antigen/teichoic acid export membrane protein